MLCDALPVTDFRRDGYVVIRGLLSDEEVQKYRVQIQSLSNLDDSSFATEHFECPDGVSKNRDFWPLIFQEQLVVAIRRLLGPTVRYTQHSDLHAHRTGGWHRDCACRKYGVGPDWSGNCGDYNVVRVAIYLQSFEESGSALGVVPGSHRFESRVRDRHLEYWRFRFGVERKLRKFGNKFGVCSRVEPPEERMMMWTRENYNPWLTRPSYPVWINTEPGDCIIFDQRLYHRASPIHGPKYAVYLSYSPENQHARNHLGYYRHFRKDLDYRPLDPELVAELKTRDLFMDAPAPEQIDGFFAEGKQLVRT